MRRHLCLVLLPLLIALSACVAEAPTVMEFTRQQGAPGDFTLEKALYVSGDTARTTLYATLELNGEEVELRIVWDADGEVFWRDTATGGKTAVIYLSDLTEGDYTLHIEATATETLYLKLTSHDKFMEPRDKPAPESRAAPERPEK